MTELNVVETPSFNEIFGVSTKQVNDYTPTEIFNNYSIPEDRHFTFKLKVLSEPDKARIKFLTQASTIELLKWCKDNKIDIGSINAPALTEAEQTLYKQFIDGESVDLEDIAKINEKANTHSLNNTLYFQKATQVDNKLEKHEIIQKYVVGLSNFSREDSDGNLKAIKYKKEQNCDYISTSIWSTLPMKIKEDLYNKVISLSNITQWELINL